MREVVESVEEEDFEGGLLGIGSSLGTGTPSGWWVDIVLLIVELIDASICWVDAIVVKDEIERGWKNRARADLPRYSYAMLNSC